MKLISLLTLLLFSLGASAQFSLGVNGGILYNTAAQGTTATGVKPYGSFRVMRDVNTANFAFGIDVGSLDADASVQYVDSASGKVEFFTYNYKFAKYFVMPNISVNLHMPLAHSYWYIGGNIGYMIGKTSYFFNEMLYTIAVRTESTSGASIGAQAGYTIHATGNIDFNVEAAARYTSIGKVRASVFYFPISAGLRYNF